MKIKERSQIYEIPRHISIISKNLGIHFQPNDGSSLYKIPYKILAGQDHWDCPHGTLRLSDHWEYVNKNGDTVFVTDQEVPEYTWCIAVNTGKIPTPWKVLCILDLEKNKNIIKEIDFKNIHRNIFEVLN